MSAWVVVASLVLATVVAFAFGLLAGWALHGTTHGGPHQ